jgi:hypothetical protein
MAVSRPFQCGRARTLLHHKRVDKHEAVLKQMQREHCDLVVHVPIARELAMLGEEHKVIGAVPLLDDVESFMDFSAQGFRMQIATEKHRLNGSPEFGESFVCGCWPLVRVKRRKIDSV